MLRHHEGLGISLAGDLQDNLKQVDEQWLVTTQRVWDPVRVSQGLHELILLGVVI